MRYTRLRRFRQAVLTVAAITLALVLLASGCSDDTNSPNRTPEITAPNRAPEITAVTVTPDPVAPDSLATATAVARDLDGDALAFSWSASAGSFPDGNDRSSVAWRTPGVACPCTLRVEVSDGTDTSRAETVVAVEEPADPELAVSPDWLTFSIGASAMEVVVANDGGGTLDWTATTDPAWLGAHPPGGTVGSLPHILTVSVDRSQLAAGEHYGTVTVDSDASSVTVYVTVRHVAEPVFNYRIVASYPHDPAAFTQGLVYFAGELYEGTGLYGQSSLQRVILETGEVQQRIELPSQYFGEGILLWEDTIVQLTWQNHVAFIYDRITFTQEDQFNYTGEGWGLTHDGVRWIMSDGTPTLRFLDPQTYEVIETLNVTAGGRPLRYLNELEYVNGEVLANVWLTDNIVRIDPATGEVTSWIDGAGLLDGVEGAEGADVLNGIAYDAASDRLFVTGKLWPRLFEIELMPSE